MATFTTRTIAAAAALIATAATIGMPASAHAETVQARVSYADLDLATDAGRAVLAGRIGRAASAVCGESDAMNRIAVASCRRNAMADAGLVALAAAGRGPANVRIAAR